VKDVVKHGVTLIVN